VRNAPSKINTAEVVNIKGHSLNGRKFTLKPVNNEITESAVRPAELSIYTAKETVLVGSMIVTSMTSSPVKISV
jgi:hypothetical protein